MNKQEEDLKLHFETILKWILSCRKHEQMPICEQAVGVLIMVKFKPFVERKEIEESTYNMTIADLRTAIRDQDRRIAAGEFEEVPNGQITP